MAIAPLSSVLDTLTLLTVGQHIALLLWIIGAVRRCGACFGATPRRHDVAREAIAARRAASSSSVVTYAAGALAAAADGAARRRPDEACSPIDFHAHTKYSHDGRSGWTEDDVRAWHRGAGFDVAYITDHRTFEGAERGIAANPGVAGEGTMLLQGIEAVLRRRAREHSQRGPPLSKVSSPPTSATSTSSRCMLANIASADDAASSIETIPGNLSKVPAADPQLGGPRRAGDRDRRRLAARTVAEPPRSRAHRPPRRQSQPRARRPAPTITDGDAPRPAGR